MEGGIRLSEEQKLPEADLENCLVALWNEQTTVLWHRRRKIYGYAI